MKIEETFYYAEGAEEQRLNNATRKVLKIADEMDLSVADMMNMMTNLLAEIAFVECVDRETLLNILGTTYDLHVESAIKNETLN
jgi:hypothetical protein